MPKTERYKAKVAVQRKITLDEKCKTCLQDPILKAGMEDLLAFLRELKMKPTWYHGASYKCQYKKQAVVYITVYNYDNCFVNVATVSAIDNTCRNNVSDFVRTLDNEMKAEFISYFKPCDNYNEKGYSCCQFCDVEVDGIVYPNVCKGTKTYNIKKPTPEQFTWIKKFIVARRKYIEDTVI